MRPPGSIPNHRSDLLTFHVFEGAGSGTHPGFLGLAWSRVRGPSGTVFAYTKAFSTDPANSNTFTLTDDSVQDYGDTVLFGSAYTVVEEPVPAGWEFDDVDCSASPGVVQEIVGTQVSLPIDSSDDVRHPRALTVHPHHHRGRAGGKGAIRIVKTRKHAASGPGDQAARRGDLHRHRRRASQPKPSAVATPMATRPAARAPTQAGTARSACPAWSPPHPRRPGRTSACLRPPTYGCRRASVVEFGLAQQRVGHYAGGWSDHVESRTL